MFCSQSELTAGYKRVIFNVMANLVSYLEGSERMPFLGIGVTRASFQISGYTLVVMILLMRRVSLLDIFVAVAGLRVASAQAHAKPVGGGSCAIWSVVAPRVRSASSRRVSLVAAVVVGPVVVCVCLGSVDFRVVLCSSLSTPRLRLSLFVC